MWVTVKFHRLLTHAHLPAVPAIVFHRWMWLCDQRCVRCVCATTGCREGDKAAQTSQKTKRGLKLCSGVPAHSSQTLRLSINLLSFLYFPQKFCYKIRLESGLEYSGSQMYSEVCRNHSSRSLTQSACICVSCISQGDCPPCHDTAHSNTLGKYRCGTLL